jgi:hypothetical protein
LGNVPEQEIIEYSINWYNLILHNLKRCCVVVSSYP